MVLLSRIRNFCIISHVDHGKSTLADRLIEITGTVDKRKMREQMLDTMDLERERGITIKLQPVRMVYKYKISNFQFPISKQIQNSKSKIQNEEQSVYQLNLIDTPGHVDFTYEVSRSLAACEGAILVVDATQGIQAQTLANVNLAREHDLVLIPVVNKIDLPNAQTVEVAEEICKVLGFASEDLIFVSAKTGENVQTLLDAIVERIPPPKGEVSGALQALIFDSKYDKHRGVVTYVRVVNGRIKAGDELVMMAAQVRAQALEVGYFSPAFTKTDSLQTGEIGYIVTGFRDLQKARVGDTITSSVVPATRSLPGYREIKPMVFASIFPASGDDYALLRDAMEKLRLNDASLTFEPENLPALGYGFRTGFLGLLHMDIVQERLRREFGLELILTSPSVALRSLLQDKTEKFIYTPTEFPDPSRIASILEPWVKLDIFTPEKFIGPIMSLVTNRRGEYHSTTYLGHGRMSLHFEIPLSDIIIDFYDKLKSVSSGYASMNYEFFEYRPGDLVKLEILVAGEREDALARIVPRASAEAEGRDLVGRLKALIPRQQFAVALQAAVGGKILARETISALRKDVTAKLYGGDVTRKMKLWKKQKEGKKRLRAIGRVQIPQAAFLALLKK